MSEAESDPKIKGFAIRGVLRYVKNTGLAGGISSIIEGLEPAERELYADPILASVWYRYRAFTALLDSVNRELGDSGPNMYAVGEASGQQDAGTIFRIILSLSSVERVIGACPRFWKRYCTAGEFEILSVEKGHVHVALNDFASIDPNHCQLAAGWMKGIGVSAGAREAVMEQVKCVHRGDSRCEYEGSWS